MDTLHSHVLKDDLACIILLIILYHGNVASSPRYIYSRSPTRNLYTLVMRSTCVRLCTKPSLPGQPLQPTFWKHSALPLICLAHRNKGSTTKTLVIAGGASDSWLQIVLDIVRHKAGQESLAESQQGQVQSWKYRARKQSQPQRPTKKLFKYGHK